MVDKGDLLDLQDKFGTMQKQLDELEENFSRFTEFLRLILGECQSYEDSKHALPYLKE
jgi:hypothetical protein